MTITTNNLPEKIYLNQYKGPSFEVLSVDLCLDLHPTETLVQSKLHLRRNQKSQEGSEPLHLDGENLTLISIKCQGQTIPPYSKMDSTDAQGNSTPPTHLAYEKTHEGLVIYNPPTEFLLEIQNIIQPSLNTSLEGLYLSNEIYCTQCEAQGFRKITYYLDRPDVMSQFQVTLRGPQSLPVMLANGDLVSQKLLPDQRHEVIWKDPHKKPSYLFAIVAGDLGVIRDSVLTQSGRPVELEIYAAHGKQERCYHALDSLKKALRWDEVRFGLEYDLSRYMIVAIDDFNSGAMENKGLNIFNSKLVLADPATATDADYHGIESVVAHEYFHNWSGNRVTVRDWFQLSLKEGLTVFRDQEFSADMTDPSVQRILDVISLKSRQFPEDAGPTAHSVQPESCYAVDNFYTATVYEKGAEVIRMLQIICGKIGFRKGIDLYFKRHDGQAVTIDDFVAAIADANKMNLDTFKKWYHQSGTPIVGLTESYDSTSKVLKIDLSQTCPPTPGQDKKAPFVIPILFGLIDNTGNEIQIETLPEGVVQNSDNDKLFYLTEATMTVQFQNIQSKPILSLLRQFSAPIHLNTNQSYEDLLLLAKMDSDGFNRWQNTQTICLDEMEKGLKGGEVESNVLDQGLADLLKYHLRNPKNSAELKALLLQIPDDNILLQRVGVLGPERFLQVRRSIKRQIAQSLKDSFYLVIEECERESRRLKREGRGWRLLRNEIIGYLVEIESPDFILTKYQQADQMTDQFAMLELICHFPSAERDLALNDFLNRWKKDSLVLNKWFLVQSGSSADDTFSRVQSLLKHPSYNNKNPNHIYSLLRNFARNLCVFHREYLKTYQFLLEQIREIDERNPGVAARLCDGFNVVPQLATEQRIWAENLIRDFVQSCPHLSKNCREKLEAVGTNAPRAPSQ